VRVSRRILRPRVGEEAGLTVMELMVTLAIMSVAAVIFLNVLAAMQAAIGHQARRSDNNDQARLAVEALQREIVSANVIFDPSTETTPYQPYYTLRVYSQANATTRTPGYQCVQWIISGRALLRRSWPASTPQSATPWRTVASGIVNVDLGVGAFAVDPDPKKGGRTIDVVLLVNTSYPSTSEKTIRIATSITGRDASYAFSPNVCTPPSST
jgi:type II secretory pathway component PulJ